MHRGGVRKDKRIKEKGQENKIFTFKVRFKLKHVLKNKWRKEK
mgnify:CR=1 FL=1